MIPCVSSDIHIVILPPRFCFYLPLSSSPTPPRSPLPHQLSCIRPFPFILPLYLPPSPSPRSPTSSHFPDQVLVTSYSPSVTPTPLSWPWSRLTFLVSVVTTGCVLTSEDLEPEASNKREHGPFDLRSGLPHSIRSFLVLSNHLQS